MLHATSQTVDKVYSYPKACKNKHKKGNILLDIIHTYIIVTQVFIISEELCLLKEPHSNMNLNLLILKT